MYRRVCCHKLLDREQHLLQEQSRPRNQKRRLSYDKQFQEREIY